jgi:glycosyltransferase involved in cell wall biosynthesis
MKSLVVAQDFPWPVTIGSHLRLAQVIAAARQLGETDLFTLVPARRDDPCVLPPDFSAIRLKTVVRPPPRLSATRRLRWLISSRLPIELISEDADPPRRSFEQWTADRYDFVWFSKAATFELLGRPRLGPTVVDLDDLEDQKILSRLAAVGPDAGAGAGGTVARARRLVARTQAKMNAARWARLQKTVAADVDRVTLCSDLDATRSGLGNVVVVPNGYDRPDPPAGRDEIAEPPRLLLAGNFLYPPNADAARFLVTNILPLLKQSRPDVTVRLVGEPNEAVARLGATPDVSVAGRVETMEPELAQADLVVVPVRYGSGTRVKIIEAAANRIPVVSTALGAEGLGFENGRELIVADTARDFADACVRLLAEPELRHRLADQAQTAFLARFQWSSVRDRIRALALDVAGVVSP